MEYYGGRPTPPSTPPRLRATLTVDDYAPCPPTPAYIPPDVEQDQPVPSTSSGYWSTSELDHYTFFADPLMDEIFDDHPVAKLEPNVSDHLLYAYDTYAIPSPVLIMMQRANFDMHGLATQPVNPSACSEPLKLFSLTGGRAPLTGLPDVDQQSHKYYNKHPHPSPLRLPETHLSYRYSISSIEALQHSLRTVWSSVYPTPIPPVIIRSRDVIGPFTLSRRLDGFAFVMPTEDSIWATICQRGVHSDYRPMDPSLTVETRLGMKGAAIYYPQHIVASKFAVNIFLEVADSATRANPLCEYLGAFVLQAMDGLTINRSLWMDIDPKVQQAVYDRAPDCFEIFDHPTFGWPQLPYVQFHYYKWDRNIIGLADESPDRTILSASQGITQNETVDESDLDDDSDVTDSEVDTDQYCDCNDDTEDTDPDVDTDQYRDCDDQDTASIARADSPEQKWVSYIDWSACA